MKSYQTAWTIETEKAGAMSGCAFVIAESSKHAREITLQAVHNTYADLTAVTLHRTVQRESSNPCDYITATDSVE